MHPLAMSLAVDSVYAVPSEIPDREMVAKLLAPVLGLEREGLGRAVQGLQVLLLGQAESFDRSKPRAFATST